MKTSKPTSAQIRDRQKTKDLKRIADALENLVYLADVAGKALTAAATAAYALVTSEKAKQPPENVQ